MIIGTNSAFSSTSGYSNEVAKAERLLKLKKYDEAKETAETYLAALDSDTIKDMGVAMAWAVKGQAEWQLGQRKSGFTNMEKGMYILSLIDEDRYKDMPHFTNIFLETAARAYELGLYEKCINYNNAFIFLTNDKRNYNEESQNSFLVSVYISLKAARELKQYEKVLKGLQLVSDVAPKRPYGDKMLLQILMICGEALVKMGQSEVAVKLYYMCLSGARIKLANDQHLNFEINRQLALALENTGKLPEAKEIYESLLPTLDSSFVTFDIKAQIITSYTNIISILGYKKKALDVYCSYLPLLESCATTQENIYNLYRTLYGLQIGNNMNKEAKETFDKYLSNNSQSTQTLILQVYNKIASGDLEAARKDLDIIKAQFDHNTDVLSLDFGNYIGGELIYSTATQTPLDPTLENALLKNISYNYSPGHETYLSTISDLMCISMFNPDKQKIDNYVELYVNGINEMISNRFPAMSREQRERYWRDIKTPITSFIPFFCITCGVESLNEKGYQAALLSKGLLLRSELLLSDISKDNGNHKGHKQELEAKIESIKSIVSQEKIDDTAMSSTLAELVTESPIYSMFSKRLKIKTEDVKNALKPDEAAIEFVWMENEDNNNMLLAYLLRHDFKYPKVFIIMMQSHWNEIQKHNIYSSPILSKILWRDLNGYLSGIKKVYFAPDGPLHAISIESMPDFEKDNAIISERWDMFRLSSTREIAVKHAQKDTQSGVLFGGALYDASQESIKDKELLGRTRGAVHVVFEEKDIEESGLRAGVNYLPETLTEVNNINDLFSKAKIICTEMTGESASENNFKAMTDKGHSVIHLATHGFYWSKKDAAKLQSLSFLNGENGNNALSEEEIALRRSGLLFSGANRVLMGGSVQEGSEDGVLTAYEIAGLDLSSVDLLVLSACETGLGDIESDGVFGLQRGFKKAGTKAILMSLWKVDDRATQMLMTEFYRGYLSGKNKVEALTAAQRFVRTYEEEEDVESEETQMTAAQRRKAARENSEEEYEETQVERRKVKVQPFKDPKYWASFILLDAVD